jgi:hypothetical protein
MEKSYNSLSWFVNNFDPELSNIIFSDIVGPHLYDKWRYYDYNIFYFINSLDSINKNKLFTWLKQNT